MRYTAGCDSLRYTHRGLTADCLEYITDWFREFFDKSLDFESAHPRRIGQQYDVCIPTECNGGLFAYNKKENGLLNCLISFGGSLLSALQPAKLQDLIHLMDGYGFEATRFDSCIDDYDWSLDLAKIDEAIAAGNLKYSDRGTKIDNFGSRRIEQGFTRYFGCRSSERFGRIYDKLAQTDGRIESMRLEAELKGAQAKAVIADLLTIPIGDSMAFVGRLAAVTLGVFEFIDRSVDKRADRCPRLDWWHQFCQRFPGHVRYRVQREKTTIRRKQQWMESYVAKSLAVVRDGVGRMPFDEWLHKLVESGSARMKSHDYKVVEAHQVYLLKNTGRWPIDLPPHLWTEVNVAHLMTKPITKEHKGKAV